jgi:hypothetical protein
MSPRPLLAHLVLPAFVVAVLALGAVATPALAGDEDAANPDLADLTGTYTVDGTFTDGGKYTGMVEMKKKKTVELRKGRKYTMWDLKFANSNGWTGVGIGALVDGRFYYAMANEGKYFTVTIFRPVVLGDDIASLKRELQMKRIDSKLGEMKGKDAQYWEVKGDPWWTDVWTCAHYGLYFRYQGDWGVEGLGPEHLEQKDPLGAGRWSWVAHFYNDKGKDASSITGNTGDLVAEALDGGAWKITRRVWKDKRKGVDVYDEPMVGVGLMPDATTLVTVHAGNGSEAVGYWGIKGNILDGPVVDTANGLVYHAKLTAPESAVKKNPGLFR